MEMLEAEKENAAADSSKQASSDSAPSLPNGTANGHEVVIEDAIPTSLSHLNVTGNLCPKCGCNTLVYEEGCRKCYSCGHSEC